MKRLLLVIVTLLFSGLVIFSCALQDETGWPEIKKENKPWSYWWWMGSAVDKENLTHLLTEYHKAGLGGVHIIPIYGVKGYENSFIDYLSPKWMDMLAHTTLEADRLGMGVDMTPGTGWPYGGPHITPDYAARHVIFKHYEILDGEQLTEPIVCNDEKYGEKAPLITVMAFDDKGQIKDVSEYVNSNGVLNWTTDGKWDIYAVFAGWTNQNVKRAAPGAKGKVMNYFSKEALSFYLSAFDSAFANYKGGKIRAFYNDSYEVYNADWSVDFFKSFEKLRGYDLKLHLPALLGHGDIDKVKRLKSDYRETISDLLLKEFSEPWVQWCHNKKALTRNQAHGSPGNLLDLYAAADIPETEIFGPSRFNIPGLRVDDDFPKDQNVPDPLMLKFASSAAHVTGKNLVSSETCTWLGEHFKVALSQAKPEIDQLWISGINHIFFHGIAYSPQQVQWPGWLFYASTNFGPSNSFWNDIGYFNDYITRSQSFLQSGKPDNDILLYFPVHDIWHDSEGLLYQMTVHKISKWLWNRPFYNMAKELWNNGYCFDYISDRQIKNLSVYNGNLLSAGLQYKTILVPECEYMPLETLDKLEKLAEKGARIVFQKNLPLDVPGFADLANKRVTFNSLKKQLQNVGENVVIQDSVREVLSTVSKESFKDLGLDFIRRSHKNGHVYFITNLTPNAVNSWCPLGVQAKSAIMFDSRLMQKGKAAFKKNDKAQCSVYLQLQPGESCILKTFQDDIQEPDWMYTQPSESAVTLTGEWSIEFIQGGPQLPKADTLGRLVCWTKLADSTAHSYAGSAKYTLYFDKPAMQPEAWAIDLGQVFESARITLNDEFAGALWSFPYNMTLNTPLKESTNKLEITVTNLSANRIADLDRQGVNWKKFYDINYVNIKYKPFDASQWEPFPSGLIGPVKLVPLKKLQFNDQIPIQHAD